MALKIENFILGPIENNSYLLTDAETSLAALVDPSVPSREVLEAIRNAGLQLNSILITHAHFDHIGGAKYFKKQFSGEPQIYLHQSDLQLWQSGGGAPAFGFDFDAGDQPDILFEDEQSLKLGNSEIKVLFTPGHTPGHVTFYFPNATAAFCGDLIFYRGVGRTDLAYSNQEDLFNSIKEKIFTLPDNTLLFPGHGPSTSVGEEKENNPYI